MRRRLAVTAAALTALIGEWVGHSLAYFRVGGADGLRSGLSGGIHSFMLPLGLALLIGAGAGAAAWSRAWRALGRRMSRSAALLTQLRRGERVRQAPLVTTTARATSTASFAVRASSLALGLALAQCSLYVVQENLERALHGLPAPGLTPLLDGFGVAAWIQVGVAGILAAAVTLGWRVLGRRTMAVRWCERRARGLWERALRGVSERPQRVPHVVAARLLLRNATWQRPPPVRSAA